MNQIRIIVPVLLLSLAGAGFCQDAPISPAPAGQSGQSSGTSAPQAPTVQEPASQGESGMLGGDKPFTLMVDPDVGELNYIFGEDKDLESIQAKRGVVFSSEDMTLNSDQFEYKTLNSQLIATGKRVVVRLGDIIVTCQLFKYNPETQEGEFSGNPVVYSRDKEGRTRTTAGHLITVHNVNGKTQMRVKAAPGGPSPYIRSNGTEAPAPTETTRTQPGGRAASLTLDENGAIASNRASPVITPAAGMTAGRNSPGGNLLGVPGSDVAAGATNARRAAPRSNRIDPNNPADVESFSNAKPSVE